MSQVPLEELVHFVVPTGSPLRNRNPEWLNATIESCLNNGVRPTLVLPDPENIPLRLRRNLDVVTDAGKGLSAAVNAGFAADAEEKPYFGWIGDDDVLAPDSLRQTVGALQRSPTAPYAFGHCRVLHSNGRTLKLARPTPFAYRWLEYGTDFVPQPGSLFRRSAWRAVDGLDESLRYSLDLDIYLRLNKLGRPAYVPAELAAWRVHAASISSTHGDGEAEAWETRSRFWSPRISRTARLWRPVAGTADLAFRGLSRYGPGSRRPPPGGQVYWPN